MAEMWSQLFWLQIVLFTGCAANHTILSMHYEGAMNSKSCINESVLARYNLNAELYRESVCGQNVRDSQIMQRKRRRVDATFRGKPKPRFEILATKFHMDLINYDQTNSLVMLINKIATEYLHKCPPVIYYDEAIEKSDGLILENLFKTFPITYYHGNINQRYAANNTNFQNRIDSHCKSYILFLSDPLMTRQILGPQLESRVLLVARSSQWKLRDFLSSEKSSNIVNLLVIGESLSTNTLRERPYVLYTHKLYADGLGSNSPVVLTSWINGMLSRPHVNLFPPKFEAGFAGHRFQVTAANQPPFIFRIKTLGLGGNLNVHWDGVEIRLMNLIAQKLNFSMDISEPPWGEDIHSAVDAIHRQVMKRHADVGMSGVFITEERMQDTDMSIGHSSECAAFITLASKALPKYRAIMGPFQWPVWVCIVCIYLGAIFPIVYTDRLTLKHLLGNWGEMENMFWYVFGMFTNSLTFSGRYSWASTQKNSTRLLIGAYWLFTIIITACYTGSIIAFVTLPAFPDTVDSVTDLLGMFFRVGTLDNGGWETWFQNSTHVPTAKLYKKMEFVSTLEEGIGNVTQSFFWNYAFLGSASQLEYMVQLNYSDENISRRSALHISEDCFALFQVGYLFPKDSVYKRKIDSMIMLAQQSGLITKLNNEVKWNMQRSSTGKLLQASSSNALRERIQEERQLTTADTEGMFLLMAIGYLVGLIALVSEIVGGITNKCRQIIRRSRKSFSSNWSSKRNSVNELLERSNEEQQEHERRKSARRKGADIEDKRFGMREFNLTKSTLKELYGNYYRNEPNFVLQDGKLILETEAVTSESTACNSRGSSTEKTTVHLPHLHTRTKSMIVAQVDIENSVRRDMDEHDVNASLGILDEYLAQCNEFSGISEEGSSTLDADEHELFGSLVEPQAVVDRMEQLNLFSGKIDFEEKVQEEEQGQNEK